MRTPLPEKRACVTRKITLHFVNHDKNVIVSYGHHGGRVVEMFCADFKAGDDMQTLIMDACVMASLLLQHGYDAAELLSRLADGPSLIGQLVAGAVDALGPKA